MVGRIGLLLVFLLAVNVSMGSWYCANRKMCSGVMQYGDNNCYYPNQLMTYPQKCVTYICTVRGNFYQPKLYRLECPANGTCRRNGETWTTRQGFYCMRHTCTVSGNSWNTRSVSTSCYGKK